MFVLIGILVSLASLCCEHLLKGQKAKGQKVKGQKAKGRKVKDQETKDSKRRKPRKLLTLQETSNKN